MTVLVHTRFHALGEALATDLDRHVRARKASEARTFVSRTVSLGVTLLHSEKETTDDHIMMELVREQEVGHIRIASSGVTLLHSDRAKEKPQITS
jgi:hypothetical protein